MFGLPQSFVCALILSIATSKLLAVDTVGSVRPLDIGYRGLQASAGPVFRADQADNYYQTPGPPRAIKPLYYEIYVAQYYLRDGERIGTGLTSKRFKLDEIDYEAVRVRPLTEIIHYDPPTRRIDFFLNTQPTIPTFTYTVDETKLRAEGDVHGSDAELGFRVWKSAINTTIEARYESRRGDLVSLTKKDGLTITVAYDQFGASDQKLIDRLSGKTPPKTAVDKKELVARITGLGERAANGDLTAIDELDTLADELYDSIAADDGAKLVQNILLIQPAFITLSDAAAEGRDGAFRSLVYATEKRRLKGFAAQQGLGRAAYLGHRPSLERLLDYKKHKMLPSTATKALILSAKKGIPEAVTFMLHVMETEKSKYMMRAAAEGLDPIAIKGDPEAIAAVKKYQEKYGPDLDIVAGR